MRMLDRRSSRLRWRLRRALAGVLGAAALLSALPACNNDCNFSRRCAGDTLEVCGDGPDQFVNRKISREPCESPNTVCVERGDSQAECILPAETICDDSFQRRCEGQTLIVCTPELGYADSSDEPERYEVGVPCEGGETERRCVDYGNDASCVE